MSDVNDKKTATREIMNALRSPLMLMSIPDCERVMQLAQEFNVSALDLLELATSRARES